MPKPSSKKPTNSRSNKNDRPAAPRVEVGTAASEEVKSTSNDSGMAETTMIVAPNVQVAINAGLSLIKEGKSKADAARAIFDQIKDEEKDVIVAAFVSGATLTPKGAMTYWYNCKRRVAKQKT